MSLLSTLPAGTYTIDSFHSRIGFSARHAMIAKVRGAFTEYSGSGTIADAGASLNIEISASSIDTGTPDRDAHLKSPDFFDATAFPKLTFVSTSIKDTGESKAVVTGNLTIKGVTKPITIEFDYVGTSVDPYGNARYGFEGQGEINRKDFGLTWNVALETGGFLVSESIKLDFEISAIAAVKTDASK